MKKKTYAKSAFTVKMKTWTPPKEASCNKGITKGSIVYNSSFIGYDDDDDDGDNQVRTVSMASRFAS